MIVYINNKPYTLRPDDEITMTGQEYMDLCKKHDRVKYELEKALKDKQEILSLHKCIESLKSELKSEKLLTSMLINKSNRPTLQYSSIECYA